MFLGLDLSGEATKLNIVIIPFKNSHCPSSPLKVFKVAELVIVEETINTALLGKISSCSTLEGAENCAFKVSSSI
jgi:hypothetical protein